MTIPYDKLPLEFGVPVGEYTLRVPHMTDQFHGATFVDGVTTGPVLGRAVMRLHQASGSAMTIERYGADPAAPAQAEPEPQPETLPPPPGDGKTSETEPGASPDTLATVADEDLEALTRDELFELATSLGAEPDGRWGERRLIKAIRSARS